MTYDSSSDFDTDGEYSEPLTTRPKRLHSRHRQMTQPSRSVDMDVVNSLEKMVIDDSSTTLRSVVSTDSDDCVLESIDNRRSSEINKDIMSCVSTNNNHPSVVRGQYIVVNGTHCVSTDEGYYSHNMDTEDSQLAKSARLSDTDRRLPGFHYVVQTSEVEAVFSQDNDGDTRLHLAIILMNCMQIEHFISLAPNQQLLNIVNHNRQTPLHLAVILKMETVARRLMTSGASVDVRDCNGNTPLHIACREGDISLVQCLLKPVYYQETFVNKYEIPYQRIPQDLEIKNYEGHTCLHIAGLNNHVGVMELLLKKGAKINSKDGKSGRTILHHAAETGNQELIEFLLKQRKIDINCLTYGGRTPVYLAAGRGHSKIVEYLIANGADCSYLRMRDDAIDEEDIEIIDDFHINGKPISINVF